jgi:hypothetical protein
MENHIKERTFSRQQFYEFVWSAPLAAIAKELDCKVPVFCDVCTRYKIPRPYSGYWTLKAKGKSPEVTPLPINDAPEAQTLTFYFGENITTSVNELTRELQYDEEIRELLEKARKLGEVVVPAKLNKPHRLVANTKAEDDWRIRNNALPFDKRSYLPLEQHKPRLAITVSHQQLGRAYRIMDALIKRIEKLGGEVRVSEPRYTHGRTDTQVWFCGELV